MNRWYRSGKVNLTKGSANVIGANTYWRSAPDKPEAGDAFTDNKSLYEILEITGDSSMRLDRPYEGDSATNQSYAIIKVISQNGMTRISGQVTDVLNKLGDKITVSTSAPSSGQGSDGDIWIVVQG